MANRTQPHHDDPATERRNPATDDLDPDGMDPETEGDELEAGTGGPDGFDDDDHVEPDGARDSAGKP